MRFEQPSWAQEVHERQEGLCGGHGSRSGGSDGSGDIEEGPAFCIPADGVLCTGCKWDAGRKVCFRNDCDALFTPPELRQQQHQWDVTGQPQLIITAGPERSGSTWLFNAVRLLFQHARQPLDAYWIKEVTDGALDARRAGVPGAHHVLVKTHAWSQAFDLGRATHVLVTHRDLRQVLASFRRMTWEFELPASFVEDHFKWKEVAELDLAFEDIISRPLTLLADLATRLGLEGVDLPAVLQEVSNLPVPKDWVDPVTQLWPSHISAPLMEARKQAAAVASAAATDIPVSSAPGSNKEVMLPPSGGRCVRTAVKKSLEAAMGEGHLPRPQQGHSWMRKQSSWSPGSHTSSRRTATPEGAGPFVCTVGGGSWWPVGGGPSQHVKA